MLDENGQVASVNAAETIDDGRLNDGTTGIRSLRAGVITAPGGDGEALPRNPPAHKRELNRLNTKPTLPESGAEIFTCTNGVCALPERVTTMSSSPAPPVLRPASCPSARHHAALQQLPGKTRKIKAPWFQAEYINEINLSSRLR